VAFEEAFVILVEWSSRFWSSRSCTSFRNMRCWLFVV